MNLKPWAVRKSKEQQLEYIQSNLQKQLAGQSGWHRFAFPPPSIPGIGTSGGVTMILEDRSGSDDPATLTKNVFAFLGAISKRPEIAAAIPSYQPAVPQLLCRCRQGEGAATAGRSLQHLHNHANLHGRLSR